jgi:hypothetical protein
MSANEKIASLAKRLVSGGLHGLGGAAAGTIGGGLSGGVLGGVAGGLSSDSGDTLGGIGRGMGAGAASGALVGGATGGLSAGLRGLAPSSLAALLGSGAISATGGVGSLVLPMHAGLKAGRKGPKRKSKDKDSEEKEASFRPAYAYQLGSQHALDKLGLSS